MTTWTKLQNYRTICMEARGLRLPENLQKPFPLLVTTELQKEEIES